MKIENADDSEPILENEERTVRPGGGGSSELVSNLPDEACRIIGFDEGDKLLIDVYRDHIEIYPQE